MNNYNNSFYARFFILLCVYFLCIGRANAQYSWENSSFYDDGVSTDRQWYIQSNNDTVYTLGAFGVRTIYFPQNGNPELLKENTEPANHTKWARGCDILDDILYVVTRQASAGKTEKYTPLYRFRFDRGITDYSKSIGDFDKYEKSGNAFIDERGEPAPNFGKRSARMYVSRGNASKAILSKSIDYTKGMYSSFWCKVSELGNGIVSMPLYQLNDEITLSLTISSLEENKVAITLSDNFENTENRIVVDKDEWFCIKVFADETEVKMWSRSKECGEWILVDHRSGINADKLCIGVKALDSDACILVDDYYCNPTEIDDVSYVNGSLEILDSKDLHSFKKLYSDIKLIAVKVYGNLLIASGIWGFNIYSIEDEKNPILLYAYRDSSYTEYQSFDVFEQSGKTYVVFSTYSKGISIWDITIPEKTFHVQSVSHKGLNIDGYDLTDAYTFGVLADLPFVYSTIAVGEIGSDHDCRGLMVYDLSDLSDVQIHLYPIPSCDWYKQKTDDYQPTTIERYENYLFVNMSEKGLAYYDNSNKGIPSYQGIIQMSSSGTIKPFSISDNGTIYVGGAKRSTIYQLKKHKVQTTLSDYDDVIYVDSIDIPRGKNIYIPISLRNTNSIKALSFDIELPDGIQLTSNKNGEAVSLSSSIDSFQLYYNEDDSNIIHVAVASLNGGIIACGDDNLVILKIDVQDNVLVGETFITFKNIEFTYHDYSSNRIPFINSKVNLVDFLLGDVNKDGSFTIADFAGIVNYVIGKHVESLSNKAADINSDGRVSITDAAIFIDEYLLNENTRQEYCRSASGSKMYGSYNFRVPFEISVDSLIVAFQMDVELPEGFSLIEINSFDETHKYSVSNFNNGVYRIYGYSFDNKDFGNEISLELLVESNSIINGSINVSNIEFVDSDIISFSRNNLSIPINTEADFIKPIGYQNHVPTKYYDLGGRLIDRPSKGFYITNQKKIIVK